MRRLWSILDRSVILEALPPMFIGFLTYTFILLTKSFFEFAELIIRRGLGVGIVGRLLALSLPHIIVLTLPMAMLFGMLIAVGRLSADSEIVAWRASGVSLMRLYRPIFLLSLAAAVLNFWLMVEVLPWGNRSLQRLKLDIVTSALTSKVEPRVFYEQFENKVLYVQEQAAQGSGWRGVFLADVSEPDSPKVVVAERGEVVADRAADKLWLVLGNARTHIVDNREPDRYLVNTSRQQRIVLRDQFEVSERSKIGYAKGLRELNLPELFAAMKKQRGDPANRRLALVEIHKKFSIPAACLVFGLLGLPLGHSNRRGGRSAGFAVSIGVILFYYVLINNGEELARDGTIPAWISMWAPNLVLAAIGMALFRRSNADKKLIPVPRALRGWLVRQTGGMREVRKRRAAAAGQLRRVNFEERRRTRRERGPVFVVLRIPRFDLRFPNLLDRYVMGEFGKIFGMVMASVLSLYLIVDYTDKVQDISRNSIPFDVVFAYYRYFSPQVLYDSLPIAVLVGTLVCFGLFSKNNEITAFKANGVSLYRVAFPVLAVALLLSGFSYLLLDFVLPYSNQRAFELKDRMTGDSRPKTYASADRQWLFGQGTWLYNYLHYDRGARTMHRMSIFDFDDRLELNRRIYARQATWNGEGWVLRDGWVRDFGSAGDQRFRRFRGSLLIRYPEGPEYFQDDAKSPKQMSWVELRSYIEELRVSGYKPTDLEVQLWQKTAFPAVTLVMALIAVPFSFSIGKRGAMYGVGIAILVGMAFIAALRTFSALGGAGILEPALAAWSPNVLFAMLGTYLFLHVRT